MKLFALVLSLHLVTQGQVGVVCFEEDTDKVDWIGLEIGHLLTRFIDTPKIAEKLKRLPGTWPFNVTSRCQITNTRDVGYREFVVQGRDYKLRVVPSCGFNQLMTSSERDRRLETRLDRFYERRNSHDSGSRGEKRVVGDKTSRVVGGQEVVDGAWPWLAAVGSKAGGPRCGGSLIADRWVLTAAHCFHDVEKPCSYNVRLGSSNWLYDNGGNHVDVTVQAIYRHPHFDKSTMKDDVALLKLLEPAALDQSSAINAICLPTEGRSLPVGSVCLAAGWGKIAENSSGRVLNAREVELPIMAYENRCGKYDVDVMRPGMLCAGYDDGNHDTCQGDSGGPLTHNVDGRWTLIGLTSFGDGCARPGFPGVYTDVGHHLRWIAAVINRFS